jgi:ABC-2 type transport system permease protein
MSGVEPAAVPPPPPAAPGGAPAVGSPANGGVQATDVIHDIGFRHYDGTRFGRGWIVRSLLVETLRGVFGLGRPARSKVLPWILVGILLLPPLVVAFVAVLTGTDELPISYTEYATQMQFVINLFVAGAAPYCVSRDLRHGVMPLYLSRPMVRTDYVWARFGGLTIGLFAVLALPQTLLLVGALLAKLPFGDNVAGWAGGVLTSAFLAVLLAAISLVIAAFTPRRGLGVAAIITVLTVVNGMSFALSEIAGAQGYDELAHYAAVLDPFRLVDGIAVRVLGVDSAVGTYAPPGTVGLIVFIAVWLVMTAGCAGLLARRYRKVGVV